jgi:alkylation response protein AidB-like acyl-CoA dehydrogenase
MDEKYGGHCKLGFGQISFVPTLFESHSPPPNQISLVIQVARNTEEDAVTLITCDAFLNEFDETRVSYDIYDPKYPQDVLDEGPDYNGDTVPYPKAFGTVTHVTPLRLADDGSSRPTYHLGGLSYGTYARVVSTFTSADSGTATTVKTTAAHGYSNGQSISINGSVNFNGTHTISNVTSDTFRIPVAFPNDD